MMILTTVFEMTVYTTPIPLARPRVVGKRTYTPKRSQQAKSLLALHARSKYRKEIHTGPMGISIKFIHKRPKRLGIGSRVPKSTIPDGDNLLKLVLDALEGIIYKNDGQFCKYNVEDWYGDSEDSPQIIITISTVSVTHTK